MKHYIIIKNIFVAILLQYFTTAQILERHINDCFEVTGKQMVKMAKKGEIVKFKNCTRKIKPPFIDIADFESILILENNGKQNPDES